MEAVRDVGEGRLEVDLLIADPRWLTRLVLGLLPHARVLAPQETAADAHGRRTGDAQTCTHRPARTMGHDRITHVRICSMTPLIANLGPTELLLILAVLVLLFGATKLPDLARGSGRALRIFKAETKGLMDDGRRGHQDPGAARGRQARSIAEQRAADLEAEAERLRRGETA